MSKQNFGEYLRKLRKDKGITLKKLGSLVDLSHSYLSQIENGRREIPAPEILKKLAASLGATYAELMVLAGYWGEEDLLEPIDFSSNGKELQNILNQPGLRYKGIKITDDDRQIIKLYLDTVFKKRLQED